MAKRSGTERQMRLRTEAEQVVRDLRELRAKNPLLFTVEVLAAFVGAAPRSVQRWFAGSQLPTRVQVVAMRRKLRALMGSGEELPDPERRRLIGAATTSLSAALAVFETARAFGATFLDGDRLTILRVVMHIFVRAGIDEAAVKRLQGDRPAPVATAVANLLGALRDRENH